MKIERWENETDEEWTERLTYETAIANNTETTNHYIQRLPEDETQFIIQYVDEGGMVWREHPEGPFNAKQVLEWKKKAEKWDELRKCLNWGNDPPVEIILRQFHALNIGNQDKRKKLEAITKHRLKLVNEITGHDNPFRYGGSIKFTTSHGDQLEIWFNDLWKILEAEE